jgi:hypothetical protein
MSGELKIRSLQVEDCRTLARLIAGLVDDTKNKWIENIVRPQLVESEDEAKETLEKESIEKFVSLFASVLKLIVERFENEVTEWFASLLGVSAEEYLKLPFDTDLVVIEQIISSDRFPDFFSRACALYRGQEMLRNAVKKIKAMFGSSET